MYCFTFPYSFMSAYKHLDGVRFSQKESRVVTNKVGDVDQKIRCTVCGLGIRKK